MILKSKLTPNGKVLVLIASLIGSIVNIIIIYTGTKDPIISAIMGPILGTGGVLFAMVFFAMTTIGNEYLYREMKQEKAVDIEETEKVSSLKSSIPNDLPDSDHP